MLTFFEIINLTVFSIYNCCTDISIVCCIPAQKTKYHVFVRTGNKMGAGTDANVYIILYGEIDDTG